MHIHKTIIIPANDVPIIKPSLVKLFGDAVRDMFIVPLYDESGAATHYISSGIMSKEIIDSLEKLNALVDACVSAKVIEEKDRAVINESVSKIKTESKDPYKFMEDQQLKIVKELTLANLKTDTPL